MITRRNLCSRVKVLNPAYAGDPRGDRTLTWPDADDITAEPGLLLQTASVEVTTDTGTTVTSDWTLYLLPGSAVTARSRVLVDGERFDVVGRPDLRRKRGRPEFFTVRLSVAS